MFSLSRALYIACLATAALVALLFETDLLPIGTVELGEPARYWLTIVIEVLTLVAIYVAVKWHRMGFVARHFGDAEPGDSSVEAQRSAIFRITTLYVPLLTNLLMYYVFATEPSFAYLALMVVVAFIFVWPAR